MPTYEYVCTSCNNEWEAEQSIKDAALTDCPACHNATARRQISRGTGFILKGSGWYSDLYASSSNKKPDSGSSGGSSGSSSSGSDSSGGSTPSTPSTPSAPSTPSTPSSSGTSGAA